jgi:hypothetical protein
MSKTDTIGTTVSLNRPDLPVTPDKPPTGGADPGPDAPQPSWKPHEEPARPAPALRYATAGVTRVGEAAKPQEDSTTEDTEFTEKSTNSVFSVTSVVNP